MSWISYEFNNLCLNPYCNLQCGKNHFLPTFHPMMLNPMLLNPMMLNPMMFYSNFYKN